MANQYTINFGQGDLGTLSKQLGYNVGSTIDDAMKSKILTDYSQTQAYKQGQGLAFNFQPTQAPQQTFNAPQAPAPQQIQQANQVSQQQAPAQQVSQYPQINPSFGADFQGGQQAWIPQHAQNIKNLYTQYLGRTPSETEVNWWLQNEPNIANIEASIKGSPEFANKQQAGQTTTQTAPQTQQPNQITSWIQQQGADNALRMAQAQREYQKRLEGVSRAPERFGLDALRQQQLGTAQQAAQLANQQRMTLLGIQDNPNLTMSQIVGQQGQARQVLGAQLQGVADIAQTQQQAYENALKESQYQQNLEAEIAKTQYQFQRDLLDQEKASLANELAIAEITGEFRGTPTFQALQQDFKNLLDITGLTEMWNGAPTYKAKQDAINNAINMAQNEISAFNAQTAAGKTTTGTAEQNKVATFVDRTIQAHSQINELEGYLSGLGTVAFLAYQKMPDYLKPEQFKLAEQAQRNFINAVLRRESGAAISEAEFQNAYKQYFPQPGDSQKVIEQKKGNRETVINGLMREAGPASSFNLGGTQAPGSNQKLSNIMFQNLGSITGIDGSPYWRAGLDIDLRQGTPIKSPVTGTVVATVPASKSGGFGNQVQIKDSNGNVLWFSHLSGFGDLKPGQKVQKGSILGFGGNSGNVIAGEGNDGSHLDLTILKAGKKPDYSNKGANQSFYTAREVVNYLEKYA